MRRPLTGRPWRVSHLKAAVFVDGGHLRVLVRQAHRHYNADYIKAIADACVVDDEILFGVLYYDRAPYQGHPKLPVSGQPADFQGSDT